MKCTTLAAGACTLLAPGSHAGYQAPARYACGPGDHSIFPCGPPAADAHDAPPDPSAVNTVADAAAPEPWSAASTAAWRVDVRYWVWSSSASPANPPWSI